MSLQPRSRLRTRASAVSATPALLPPPPPPPPFPPPPRADGISRCSVSLPPPPPPHAVMTMVPTMALTKAAHRPPS
ncbi:MAG: hypothetical protein E6H58_07920 [Betaproteobacteria bacterium]|nr:MAG: hypothetical protein E6H65_01590 [Betaproteobacteria bacterium]TMH33715.1 MAG: hypothetical protein E6H58_07920 [Betaproteobacteria bacterium]